MELAATDTLSGVAGTATAVTYSVYGDDITTSGDAFKLLAQGQFASAVGTIVPAPGAGHQYIIKEILIANATASAVSGVKVYANGTLAANQLVTINLVANGSATYTMDDGWRVYDGSGQNITSTNLHATTVTTASFVIPALAGSVAVSVLDGVAFPNGAYAVFSDGTHAMIGHVTAGGGTTSLTVTNDKVTVGAVGNTVASGATVTFAGTVAVDGTNGHGATTTSSITTIPAIGSNVVVAVVDGAAFQNFAPVYITDSSNVNYMTGQILTGGGTNSLTVRCWQFGGTSIASASAFTFWGAAPSLLSAAVTIPALLSTVVVNVGYGGGYPLNSWVQVTDGTNAFIGQVTSGGGTNALTVKNYYIFPGSGTTVALSGGMVTYSGPVLDKPYDAEIDFGFVGDLITTNSTSACNSGAPTKITDTANPFTAYYLNKRITLTGAGVGGAQYVGTITNVDSAGQVTVSPNITTTVASKIASFGTDNTTAINTMLTQINTTNAAFPGATIIWNRGVTGAYGLPIPCPFTKTCVWQGIGGGFNADNGDYTRIGGTRWAWWGTTSDGGTDFGAMLSWQPAGGATQAISNPGIYNGWLDGRNGDQQAALYGVQFAGCHAPVLFNVFAIDFRAAGYLCNATAVTLNPTADRGVLRPNFRGVYCRNLETFTNAITTPITTSTAITLSNTGQNITVSAATMPVDASSQSYAWIQNTEGTRTLVKYTGGGTVTLNVKCSPADALHSYVTIANGNVVSASPINAACMTLDGDATANTNCGNIASMQFTHGGVYGPAALDIRNADSVDFYDVYINGGSPTATTNPLINRVTKEGVTLAGSNTSNGLAARNITFHGGDPSSAQAAGVTVFGLTATGTLLLAPSGPHYWDLMQLGNGARVPNIEVVADSNTQGAVGGHLDWTPNGGWRPGRIGRPLSAQQTLTAAVINVVRGTVVPCLPQCFQVGTTLRWTVYVSKTAAGVAARLTQIRYTNNGANTGGTIIATVSHTPTAVIDAGKFVIEWTVGTIGAAATSFATCHLNHELVATGLSTAASVPNVPAVVTPATGNIYTSMTMVNFDSTLPASGPRYLHLEFSAGAAEVLTVLNAYCECIVPGGP